MIKFCKINDEYIVCDNATIEKYKLKVEFEITEEEFSKYDNTYYTDNGKLVLGYKPQNEENMEE